MQKDLNTRKKNPIIAFFYAWIIPGMGHFYLGKKVKAFFFFLSVNSLFIFGVIAGGDVGWYELNFLVFLGFIAKFMTGIVCVITAILKPLYDNTSMYYEIGNALLLMAGSLNMLIIIDVFDEMRGRKPH